MTFPVVRIFSRKGAKGKVVKKNINIYEAIMKKFYVLFILCILCISFVSCKKQEQTLPSANWDKDRDLPYYAIDGKELSAEEIAAREKACQAKYSEWQPLFDGKTLDGWKASESQDTWKVADGLLVSGGERSHLFYDGPVGNHDFKNFELKLQFKLEEGSNSGLFLHTEFDEAASPPKGYEIQINSSSKEDRKTGSLFAVRAIYKDFLTHNEWSNLWLDEWHNLWVKVSEKRIMVKVNDQLLADYVEPENAPRSRKGRLLSSGTFALQAHDPTTKVAYRDIQVKLLADDQADAEGDTSYIPDPDPEFVRRIDQFGSKNIPIIDYHIHLRGDMNLKKSLINQSKTGIQSGVLENAGRDWPLSDNEKIETFIAEAEKYPVYIGLQVNDRDWFTTIDANLIKRLDYVLADTMIMADENGNPRKLWLEGEYEIEDPEAWMERYFAHCMTVVNEPIDILANPTYLPDRVAASYDTLWTEERMTQLIEAGIKNNVAFEIQAGTVFPKEKFIELCKTKGAKFSIGRNNHDDKPMSMDRCFDMMEKFDLKPGDMFRPGVDTARW